MLVGFCPRRHSSLAPLATSSSTPEFYSSSHCSVQPARPSQSTARRYAMAASLLHGTSGPHGGGAVGCTQEGGSRWAPRKRKPGRGVEPGDPSILWCLAWTLLLSPGVAEAGDWAPISCSVKLRPPKLGQGLPEAPGVAGSLHHPHLPGQGGRGRIGSREGHGRVCVFGGLWDFGSRTCNSRTIQ